MKLNKPKIAAFIVATFIIIYSISVFFQNGTALVNMKLYDMLIKTHYSLFGPKYIEQSIIQVNIDDTSVKHFGNKIWGRTICGELITTLTNLGAKAIVFDLIFPNKSEDTIGDNTLIEATAKAKNTYYPVIFDVNKYFYKSTKLELPQHIAKHAWDIKVNGAGNLIRANKVISTFPELSEQAKGLGFINGFPDNDGIFRRYPVILKYNNTYFPSIISQVAADILNVKAENITVLLGEFFVLRNATMLDGTKKDIRIPIDKKGQMIINFAGPWTDSFANYSVTTILSANDLPNVFETLSEEFEDAIVIISDTSTSGRDYGAIPLDSVYPLSGLHTNTLNTILSEQFIRIWPELWQILYGVFLVILLIIIAIRFNALLFSLSWLAIIIFNIGFSIGLFFLSNQQVNIVVSTTSLIVAFVLVHSYRYFVEERQRAFLRNRLEQYFAPNVLEKIVKTPGKLENADKKVLTILFIDIKGFTSWCTTQDPQTIHDTLNEYFEEMNKIIFKYEGTIDKYIGDGLMVFFGDPIDQPDHALRAVKAAIEMQQKVRQIKIKWEKEGRLPIMIRIGINTGEVIVGNMGSHTRMDYTVLGANVNLAARLESSAPIGGILISETVQKEIKSEIKTKYSGKITAKGITDEFKVYVVVIPD